MNTLIEYYERIRTYMRHSKTLYSNQSFPVLCASMDILHDTIDAMTSYVHVDNFQRYSGIEYVYVYGIINVLEVQQDALRVIYEILTGRRDKFKGRDQLERIRMIRNDIFGHAIEYDEKKNRYKGIGITRSNLSIYGFEATDFLKFSKEDRVKYRVDVKELISIQLEEVCNILGNIVNFLEETNPKYIKISHL